MSGKWPIFAVLGLGLVASLCAAVLMAAMRAGEGEGGEAAPATVEVVIATSDLPPMTRLEQAMLETRGVPVGEAPEGSFRDPIKALGRVLKTPLVAGQPVIESGLLSDEDGAKLASSLPPGLRAVSIELPGSSAMRGLLYPGCRVDVLVAYKRTPGRFDETSPGSRTLLQNVNVLAVEDKTVFTEEKTGEEGEEAPRPARRNNRTLMVTLMVDPQQARELQSARDRGELALSLRNPLDSSMTEDPSASAEVSAVPVEPAPAAPEEMFDGPWRTLIIRGDETEVVTFNAEDDWPPVPPERFADAPTEPPLEIEE